MGVDIDRAAPSSKATRSASPPSSRVFALVEGLTRLGKRLGADRVDRVCDRTVGKPVVALTITRVEPDLAADQRETATLLEARLDLAVKLGELLAIPSPHG